MSTRYSGRICPRCGSNLHYELRSGGSTTYYGKGVRANFKDTVSVGICRKCGYRTNQRITNSRQKSKNLPGTVIKFCIGLFIFSVMIASCASANDKNKTWATEPTPIEKFRYYIDDNDYLHLTRCNTNDPIYIASEYEVEGKIHKVVSLEGAMFFRHSSRRIIISEGITSIDYGVFNNSGAKYVYLPSTLTDFPDISYLSNGEELYYGGSEEAWFDLCKVDRRNIDFEEIIFNAKISDLFEK